MEAYIYVYNITYMGVSKNKGKTTKWMVYFMENLIEMDDLGVALFLETPQITPLGRNLLINHPTDHLSLPRSVRWPGMAQKRLVAH